MRSIGLTAICLVMAGVSILGCSGGGTPGPDSSIAEVGTLSLPLETFGQSGMRYRLHNARFEIRDRRTARVRAVLNSDDEPFSSIISAELDSGEYQVMLLPGWFIEQVDGGFGGTGPVGPTPGPTATVSPPTPTVIGPTFPPPAFTEAPTPSTGPRPTESPGFTPRPQGITTDVEFEDAVTSEPTGGFSGVTSGTGASGGTGGGFTGVGPTGTSTSPGGGRIINAALESDAIQNFTIFPNNSSFVFYTFRVGDNVISFEPGTINVIFEVIEDGVVNPNPTDPCDDAAGMKRPSVIETSTAALRFVTLRDVFNAMAVNDGFSTDGEMVYKEIIDSYASAGQARLPDAIHCGDETTNGVPSLNGYPIDCDRQERFQFDNLDFWQPTAFVNRFDLAPESGAHCGQQRMVFSSNAINRMFFILEAQVPNPRPELGIEGCMPLARFWADQVQIEDATLRGLRLTNAFLSGDAGLQEQGFGPFVKASNYTVGTGQIRTNNFDDGIWTLREFKLAADSDDVKAIPFPVAEAPHGPLWNDTISSPNGELCREAFLTSLQGLLLDEPNAMTFVVPHECKDAESRNTFEQDYGSQMAQGSGVLIEQIEALVGNTGLSAFDIANRASFAGSCIGCHSEAVGRDLGNGVSAPFSLDFVHVGEFTESCPDGSECFQTSSGLKSSFLPHRIDVLSRFTDVSMPPSCEDGPLPEFDAGVDVVSTDFAVTGESLDEGVITSAAVVDGGVAEPVAVELPPAETPVADLVQQDEEIREQFGRRTVGGQDARVSH